MIRAFVALELPANIRERLAMIRPAIPDARWVEADDMHLTLRFLGACQEPVLDDICERLADVTPGPLELIPSELGCFGHSHMRAVWIGIEKADALDHLRRHVERIAQNAGLEPDGRKYAPHITLARMTRAPSPSVARALGEQGRTRIPAFHVRTMTVLSSGRSRGGGPYRVEARYDLEPENKVHDQQT
ncbi:MAG: RNA 2',3'-cyclic phosphodiesterase [Pseudomonadota bacterium]